MKHSARMACLALGLWAVQMSAQAVTKTELLAHISQQLGQRLQQFQLQTEGLLLESQAFCERPTGSKLTALQHAWLETSQVWAAIEPQAIGPLVERRSARQINAWPVRPKLLQPLLTLKQPLSTEQLNALGLSARGLPAVEWLLYPDKRLKPAAYSGRRCELLQGLSQQLVQEAQALNQQWPAFSQQWAKGSQSTEAEEAVQTALSDWINLTIAATDQIKSRKLNKPLAAVAQGEVREHLEAWRSQQSLLLLKQNLASLEQNLVGSPHSLLALLKARSLPIASDLLQQQMQRLLQAQKALKGNSLLRALNKQPKQVKALQLEVQALQILLEHQIADALGVDLGFNVSDGD